MFCVLERSRVQTPAGPERVSVLFAAFSMHLSSRKPRKNEKTARKKTVVWFKKSPWMVGGDLRRAAKYFV
jgi:hypothetical protein